MSRPKRGILKGRTHYGPALPNPGVMGNPDDNHTLEQNTLVNEMTSGDLPQVNAQTVGPGGVLLLALGCEGYVLWWW